MSATHTFNFGDASSKMTPSTSLFSVVFFICDQVVVLGWLCNFFFFSFQVFIVSSVSALLSEVFSTHLCCWVFTSICLALFL